MNYRAFMDAYLIFDEFSIIDLVSWTAMIIGMAGVVM